MASLPRSYKRYLVKEKKRCHEIRVGMGLEREEDIIRIQSFFPQEFAWEKTQAQKSETEAESSVGSCGGTDEERAEDLSHKGSVFSNDKGVQEALEIRGNKGSVFISEAESSVGGGGGTDEERMSKKGSVFMRVANEVDVECTNAYSNGESVVSTGQEGGYDDAPVANNAGENDSHPVARAITDEHSTDTMEKVDSFCALAEVSMEREDIESCVSNYKKALSILDRLVEDSLRSGLLNIRICCCLEALGKPREAIPYAQRALVIYKAYGAALASSYIDMFAEEDSISELLSAILQELENMLDDLQQEAHTVAGGGVKGV